MKYYVVNKTDKHNLAHETKTCLIGLYNTFAGALRAIKDSINILYNVDNVNIKFCLDNISKSCYIGYIIVENDQRYDIYHTSVNE